MPDDLPIRHEITLTYEHVVHYTEHVFAPDNHLLADVLVGDDPVKVVVFVDDGLLPRLPELPEMIGNWFDVHPGVLLTQPPVILPGGEVAKNDWDHLKTVWKTILAGGICRHSYVIAVGGGALLDMVGFGASTAHRGVKLVRIPTTSLAQGDGGVGVKNAVNLFDRKNWVGTFQIPTAVINDTSFLPGLPDTELRGGVAEALKVALIKDRALYAWIGENRDALAALEAQPLSYLLRHSAELHVAHIATSGDPFELGSARPLDFGHWAAHKLEQISRWEINHGQAVAVGMAIDIVYAVKRGLLAEADGDHILSVMADLKLPIYHSLLRATTADGGLAVLEGLNEFREHLGGDLTVTLVTSPGESHEVHEMDHSLIRAAIDDLGMRALGAEQ